MRKWIILSIFCILRLLNIGTGRTISRISLWVFEINGNIYIPGWRGDSSALTGKIKNGGHRCSFCTNPHWLFILRKKWLVKKIFFYFWKNEQLQLSKKIFFFWWLYWNVLVSLNTKHGALRVWAILHPYVPIWSFEKNFFLAHPV